MLSKKHRINKELFKEVFSGGRSFHFKFISLKIAKNKEKEMRFAFVAPVKTAKKAVDRNKLKRRTRYITAKHLSSFAGGASIIVFLKKGSEKLKFSELEKELLTAFKKAGAVLL